MRHRTRGAALAVLGVATLLAACSSDLNITNENDPDTKRALATASDVKVLIKSSFQDWWFANQATEPNEAFAVMADVMTSSFGNFGMRFNSNEPSRIAYNNSTTSGDAGVSESPWENNYGAIGEANDGLKAIASGVELGPQYTALCILVRGMAEGNIALIFDKGAIVDENTPTPGEVKFVPYQDVAAAALKDLDQVITMTDGADWDLPSDVANGFDIDAAKMNAIANTMAARILAYLPRNAAENAKVDWARVESYARKGISQVADPFDFTLEANNNDWWDPYRYYTEFDEWMRVDMRIIHRLDPAQPAEFPDCNYVAPELNSPDARAKTDFTFYDNIPFQTARGCYHFSHWSHSRYDSLSRGAAAVLGSMPLVLQAENDLLLAEALVRQNKGLQEAADLVNKTRVDRGKLPPVGTDPTELMAAIQYEQEIELLDTGGGIQYYDRRRIDGLQPGTPHHLPVPASELETDGLPVYTFGGEAPNPVFPVE